MGKIPNPGFLPVFFGMYCYVRHAKSALLIDEMNEPERLLLGRCVLRLAWLALANTLLFFPLCGAVFCFCLCVRVSDQIQPC